MLFTAATDTQNVAEYEYAEGATIRTTAITSCLVVYGKTSGGTTVKAYHIGMLTGASQPPTIAAADEIIAGLRGCSSLKIRGAVTCWNTNANGAIFKSIYDKLVADLAILDVSSTNDGTVTMQA